MHFITLYFILIYQIRCGLSSVKFSLVWKISFSDRFYWFLLFSVWSWYALCDIKISKEKNPEKNNFLQIFRDTIMIGTRDIMGTFSSGSSGLSHIHLQYHKKTSLNTCLLIRSRKKSIVKLKVYKSGYNRYFWWRPWY